MAAACSLKDTEPSINDDERARLKDSMDSLNDREWTKLQDAIESLTKGGFVEVRDTAAGEVVAEMCLTIATSTSFRK
jgi:hypothetical protein